LLSTLTGEESSFGRAGANAGCPLFDDDGGRAATWGGVLSGAAGGLGAGAGSGVFTSCCGTGAGGCFAFGAGGGGVGVGGTSTGCAGALGGSVGGFTASVSTGFSGGFGVGGASVACFAGSGGFVSGRWPGMRSGSPPDSGCTSSGAGSGGFRTCGGGGGGGGGGATFGLGGGSMTSSTGIAGGSVGFVPTGGCTKKRTITAACSRNDTTRATMLRHSAQGSREGRRAGASSIDRASAGSMDILTDALAHRCRGSPMPWPPLTAQKGTELL